MNVLFAIFFLLITYDVMTNGRLFVFLNLVYFNFCSFTFVSGFAALGFLGKRMDNIVVSGDLGYKFKIYLKAFLGLITLIEEGLIMKGVRFDQPHDYVCKCDLEKPEKERTVFKVRFLTAKEQAKLRDQMYSVSGIGNTRAEKFLTGTSALMTLEMGLLGWENFTYDDDGTKIEYNKENFSCVPPRERDELANYIRGSEEGEV